MLWRSLREAPHVRGAEPSKGDALEESARSPSRPRCRAIGRRCSGGVCEKPLTSEVQSHRKEMLWRSLREAPHVLGAEPSEGDALEESARSPSRPRCRAIRRRCSGGVCEKPSRPRCRAIGRRCPGGVCEKPLTSRCRAPHFQVQSHQKEMLWRSLREAPHVRGAEPSEGDALEESARSPSRSRCRAIRRRCSGGVCEKPLTSEVQSHRKEMLRRSLREAPHALGAEPSEGDAPEESARSPSRRGAEPLTSRCRAIRRRCPGGVCEKPLTSEGDALEESARSPSRLRCRAIGRRCSGGVCEKPSRPSAEPPEGDAPEESARSPSRPRCRAIRRRCSGGVCEKPLTSEVQSHQKEMLRRSLREAPHVLGAEPSEGDALEESARSPSRPRCRAIRRRCSGGVCEKPLTS
ncbi:hypothetical protein NDU88_000215 [Pleurodeles waltl]|uniref:Uncharacterized protein n=1 Tax=Pleurodeles waltl TaxID=8319 RepID=A0AAV7V8E3_PLEWA|nr:hypothetical protein NDU88_000215 [Pleurodeles waltl]